MNSLRTCVLSSMDIADIKQIWLLLLGTHILGEEIHMISRTATPRSQDDKHVGQ